MRPADLIRRLADQPFQPFRIHLSDRTTIDVTRPGMVIVGASSAVLPTRFTRDEEGIEVAGDWRTVALNHMTQFSTRGPSSNGKGRKRGRRG